MPVVRRSVQRLDISPAKQVGADISWGITRFHPLSVNTATNITLQAVLVINISNYQKFDDQRILFRAQDGSTRNKATFREARAGPGIGPPRLLPAAGRWSRSRMSRRFDRPQQYQERESPSTGGSFSNQKFSSKHLGAQCRRLGRHENFQTARLLRSG